MNERVPSGSSAGGPIAGIETSIARDMARKAALAVPVVAAGLGAWRGVDAAYAVVLASVVVVVNFLAAAAILGRTARVAPYLLTGVALMSFLGRLVLITLVGVGIKALHIVDWPVFCITLVVVYFALLVWELRSISLTLAYPGLKPKPGRI